MRIISIGICILLAGLVAQTAHSQSNDIQMLPPTDFVTGQPCTMTGTNNYLLVFNPGVTSGSAINCNTSFSADPASGAVTIIGTVKSSGQMATNGFDPVNGFPSGWTGGGLHTWIVYAESGIGVGSKGSLNGFMNSAGAIQGVSLYFTGGPYGGATNVLDYKSANTLLNLQNNGVCPHGNMALFQDASHNFSCVD